MYKCQLSSIRWLSSTMSDRPMQCQWMVSQQEDNICGRQFDSIDNLAQHLFEDHVNDGPSQKEYFCRWKGCTWKHSFKARYKLNNHGRTHTRQKPFRCSFCGKRFARTENVKIHERIHTSKWKSKIFNLFPTEIFFNYCRKFWWRRAENNCTYSAEICLKICFFNVFANVDLQWITNVVSINLFKTCLRKFSWTAWRNKQPKKQNPVLLTMEFHHHSWRQILFWAEMSFAVLFLNHFQKCLIIFLYNFSHNQSNAWWSHWS